MYYLRRWLPIGFLVSIVLTFVAALVSLGGIEADLGERASIKLQQAGYDWAAIKLNARELNISGDAPSEDALAQIYKLLDGHAIYSERGVFGVRSVDFAKVEVVPRQKPFVLSIMKSANGVKIEGFSENKKTADVYKSAVKTQQPIELDIKRALGAPAEFDAAGVYLIELFSYLKTGSASLSDTNINIEGEALSAGDYDSISQALTENLPQGFRLQEQNIILPIASPFETIISKNRSGYVFEGVGSTESSEIVRDLPGHQGKTVNNLQRASGEPENYSDTLRIVSMALSSLLEGEGRLVDNTITLAGRAGSLSKKAEAEAQLKLLPQNYSVASASIAVDPQTPYPFGLVKVGDEVFISGSFPDEETRAAFIGELVDKIDNVTIKNNAEFNFGALQSYNQAIRFGVEVVSRFSDGSFLMSGDEVVIDGTAISAKAYNELTAIVEKPLTALTLKSVKIDPAISDLNTLEGDYLFVAEKGVRTGLKLTGLVSTDQLKTDLAAQADDDSITLVDELEVDPNSPVGHDLAVRFGFNLLKQLTSGKLTVADGKLSLIGVADDRQSYNAVLDALSQPLEGVEIAIQAITPPQASPYIWQIEKIDREVKLSGNMPSRKSVQNLHSEIAGAGLTLREDKSQLSRGEAGNYQANVAFATSLIIKLKDGVITLRDDQLMVTGQVRDRAHYEELLRAIESAPDEVRISKSNILPPKEVAYRWTAKKSDSIITIAGFAPDETAREKILQLFGGNAESSAQNQMKLASNAPANFTQSVEFAAQLFKYADKAAVTIEDQQLTFNGEATDRMGYEQITALLANPPKGVNISSAETKPPVESPFVISGRYNGEEVSFGGFYDSEESRSVLREVVAKYDARLDDQLSPARGALPNSMSDAAYLASKFAHSADGEFEISDRTATYVFTAKTVEDYKTLSREFRALGGQLPSGTQISSGQILPATVSNNYSFNISKENKTIQLKGFVGTGGDTGKIKEALSEAELQIVSEQITVAHGASESHLPSILFSIDVLSNLHKGSAIIEDGKVTINGEAADHDAYNSSLETIQQASPGVSVNSFNILAPIAKPYLWKVEKVEGAAAITGNFPANDIRADAIQLVEQTLLVGVQDNGQISRGAPENFAEAVQVGIAALQPFLSGSAKIQDSTITLSGLLPWQTDVSELKDKLNEKLPSNFSATFKLEVKEPPIKEAETDKVTPATCLTGIEDALAQEQIFFAPNQTALVGESFTKLYQIASIAAECPSASFVVEGHTDSDGSAKFNQALSDARAAVVVDYLSSLGLNNNRFKAEGFGEARPIGPNDTKEGRAQNRRIEFKLIP